MLLYSALEEADKELLENNRVERGHIEDEIRELRERNVSSMCLLLQQRVGLLRRCHIKMSPPWKIRRGEE